MLREESNMFRSGFDKYTRLRCFDQYKSYSSAEGLKMEIQWLIFCGGYIVEVEVFRHWMVYDILKVIEKNVTMILSLAINNLTYYYLRALQSFLIGTTSPVLVSDVLEFWWNNVLKD